MKLNLTIATCLVIAATAGGVAHAAPLSYGAGGSGETSMPDVPAIGGALPAPSHLDEHSVLQYDDKQVLGRRAAATSVPADSSTYSDSQILGDPDDGVPRFALASPVKSDSDADTDQQLAGFHVGKGFAAPVAIPWHEGGAAPAPAALNSHHAPALPDPPAAAGRPAAVWDAGVPEEYGIIDRPEFAAAVAVFFGLFVLVLITRGPWPRRATRDDGR